MHANVRSGFFTRTSCERNDLRNLDGRIRGRFLTETDAGKGGQIFWWL
jgi:hypothetical protein